MDKVKIDPLNIQGSYLIYPQIIDDSRGYFYRIFDSGFLEQLNIESSKIQQINRSYNKAKGTFRGLHFQKPPFAEEKFVSCIRGGVTDIVLDLRAGSKTFLDFSFVNLSEENKCILMIPKGCAHGFITLQDNTELLYLHTNSYVAEYDDGISIFDPSIGIDLPVEISEISEKDKTRAFINKDFRGIEI